MINTTILAVTKLVVQFSFIYVENPLARLEKIVCFHLWLVLLMVQFYMLLSIDFTEPPYQYKILAHQVLDFCLLNKLWLTLLDSYKQLISLHPTGL